jgi:hypothetical protein
MTRMTPKMIVRPMPMSAYTPPIRIPLTSDCRKIPAPFGPAHPGNG